MNSATDWFERATTKHHLGDYQGAIADFTKAISLKPDFANPYNNRGIAYLMLNQKSKALADFMRAIELGYSARQEVLDMCK
ncbi:MAG: tetratricopeptide repeat protein [Ignavibacteria bacterium]|nr:tetratricopeptide repeat protein [Ignavibacteria bacterium]